MPQTGTLRNDSCYQKRSHCRHPSSRMLLSFWSAKLSKPVAQVIPNKGFWGPCGMAMLGWVSWAAQGYLAEHSGDVVAMPCACLPGSASSLQVLRLGVVRPSQSVLLCLGGWGYGPGRTSEAQFFTLGETLRLPCPSGFAGRTGCSLELLVAILSSQGERLPEEGTSRELMRAEVEIERNSRGYHWTQKYSWTWQCFCCMNQKHSYT